MANNIIQTTELVNKLNTVLTKHSENLNLAANNAQKLNEAYKGLPSNFVKSIKNIDDAEQKLNKTTKELNSQNEKLNTSIKSKIPTLRQLAAIKRSQDAQAKREQRNLEKTTGLYNRIQQAINKVTKKYQDLAVRKQLGGKLSAREEKQLISLQAKLLKYNNALKQVDAQVGKNQRNVGNYKSALKGLGGTLRSLVGAFGLLGGAFLFVQGLRDAFNTIREFDKQLIAVKKTTNLSSEEIKLFKNEVIDLGLKLKGVSIQGLLKSSEVAGQLGVKGRENILKFSQVIEQLKLTSDIASQESVRNFAKFIEVSKDTVKNADRLGSVITELGNNFATSESQILSNATEIQKGLSIYEASAESILGLGAATSALGNEAEVSSGALQKTFQVLNQGATTGKNLQRILELTGQSAEEFRKEFGTNATESFRKFIKGLSDSDEAGENLSNTLTDLGLNNLRVSRVVGSLAKNYDTLENALNKANNEYKENNALTKEADESAKSLDAKIGDLSDSWDGFILTLESGDGVISKTFKALIGFAEDVLILIRELNRTELEFNSGLTAEAKNKQLEYYEEIGEGAVALAAIDKVNAESKISSINKEIATQQKIIDKYKDKNIVQKTISAEYTQSNLKIKELNNSLATQNGRLLASKIVLGEVVEAKKEENKVEDENIILKRKQLQLTNTGIENKTNETLKIWELKEALEAQVKELEKIVGLYPKGAEAAQKYIDKIRDLKTALGDVTQGIDVSGAMAEIEQFFEDNEFDVNPPEDAPDEWEETFNNIVNIAQQAFGIITALSDASFAKQFSNLEAQKKVALAFAGDSATARLNIEEQYDKRRKVIERRQAKAKKEQAMFEILVNTASAVVQALPNPILAAIVGALGAAQFALVASQQIPAFWQGGEVGSNQQIMVNDDPFGRKGSNYKEVVEKPNGQILTPQGKNVKMTVPKGSYIHPTYDAFINSLDSELMTNNIMPIGQGSIMPMIVNNGLSKGDLIEGLTQHGRDVVRAINNKESFVFNYDERGAEIRRKKLNKITKVMNARYSGKGLGV